VIVAQVGVGIERNWSEKDDDWLAQLVGDFDGGIERGIVAAALGALHPVDDTGSVGIRRASAADGDAGIVSEFGQRVHVQATHEILTIPQNRMACGFDKVALRSTDSRGGCPYMGFSSSLQDCVGDLRGLDGGPHVVCADDVCTLENQRDLAG